MFLRAHAEIPAYLTCLKNGMYVLLEAVQVSLGSGGLAAFSLLSARLWPQGQVGAVWGCPGQRRGRRSGVSGARPAWLLQSHAPRTGPLQGSGAAL